MDIAYKLHLKGQYLHYPALCKWITYFRVSCSQDGRAFSQFLFWDPGVFLHQICIDPFYFSRNNILEESDNEIQVFINSLQKDKEDSSSGR